MADFKLSPSLLTDSVKEVQSQLDQAAEFSDFFHKVQLDVIDGQFAENLTVTPVDLHDINWHEFSVDVHLMVEEPVDYVFECCQLEPVDTITAQIERMSSQLEFIGEVQQRSKGAGLSLDIFTPVESIEDEAWLELKIIQVMGNKAGIQGQQFAGEPVLSKIREIARIKQERHLQGLEIMVDIGVNKETIPQFIKAGATAAVVGSTLWKSENLAKTVEELQTIIKNHA